MYHRQTQRPFATGMPVQIVALADEKGLENSNSTRMESLMGPNMEKRRYRRLTFSAKDNVYGEVGFPDPSDESKQLKIADIGGGGLRFIERRTEKCWLKSGDSIILQKITGHKRLKFLVDVLLEVKWILDEEPFEHVIIGCEYGNMIPSQRRQIDRFVQEELAQKLRPNPKKK